MKAHTNALKMTPLLSGRRGGGGAWLARRPATTPDPSLPRRGIFAPDDTRLTQDSGRRAILGFSARAQTQQKGADLKLGGPHLVVQRLVERRS